MTLEEEFQAVINQEFITPKITLEQCRHDKSIDVSELHRRASDALAKLDDLREVSLRLPPPLKEKFEIKDSSGSAVTVKSHKAIPNIHGENVTDLTRDSVVHRKMRAPHQLIAPEHASYFK